jgi:aryl-alcohol dehydrogenase-like predicted oxidoreductase
VTRIGLGGEGILRTFGQDEAAQDVITAAVEQGIAYFDTAPAYSGSEDYLGAFWQSHPGAREKIFHTSKSAERSKDGALADLDRTLKKLGTEYLDLWQLHDVRTEEDMAAIVRPDGALAAFLEAKEAGKVRHIGVTGHHDPFLLARCVRDWPVDAVLLPVNPVEGVLGGFLTETLPAARDKGIAVVGMKILGGKGRRGGNYVQPESGVTAELLLRYALGRDVDVLIVGCSTPAEVRALSEAARSGALDAESSAELEEAFRLVARDMAFYRGVM